MRKYYAQDIYHKQLHKLNHAELAVVKDKVMKEIRINRYSEKRRSTCINARTSIRSKIFARLL